MRLMVIFYISSTNDTRNRLRLWSYGLLIFLCLPVVYAADIKMHEQQEIIVKRGHSFVMDFQNNVVTVAQGRPDIYGVVVLTPRRILINGQNPGSASLTIIDEMTEVTHYRVQVTHDLTELESYLKRLDPRISIVPDPNGDGIMLTGTVASSDIIQRAVRATVRFIGDTTIQLGANIPQTIEVPNAGLGGGSNTANGEGMEVITSDENFTENGVDVVVGTGQPATVFEETGGTDSTRVINLLVAEDELPPAPHRLEELLHEIHPGIKVSRVNNVFILKGEVDTAAQHVRALVLADRFVGGIGELNFTVISDNGGVLAGNLTEVDEDQFLEDLPDLRLPQATISGRNGGFGGSTGSSSRGGRRGRSSVTLSTTSIDPKGNLGQNVQRADVITVAGGRIISMIQVLQQPRVEVQLHIVSINRDKSRELGVDFEVIAEGGEIAFSSITGGFAGAANILFSREDPDADGVDISSFVRALEEHGAAKTLAEPTLTTVSGEAATFLVGGNLPIPGGSDTVVTNGVATTSEREVLFIEFGLRLVIRPTVLESGKIGMVLDQEVIEPDEDSGIVFQGVLVPGFTQRSVRTVTESYNDETWAVAGLISQDNIKSLSKVPFLSEIPILGELFKIRSSRQQNNELIITVSARKLREGVYGQETLQDKMRGRLPGYERISSHEGDLDSENTGSRYMNMVDYAVSQMQIHESRRLDYGGYNHIELAKYPVKIISDRNIKAMPQAGWEKDGIYITAVEIVNISGTSKRIDPAQFHGEWLSVTIEDDNLQPRNGVNSSTHVYLISEDPFYQALNRGRQLSSVLPELPNNQSNNHTGIPN